MEALPIKIYYLPQNKPLEAAPCSVVLRKKQEDETESS